MVLRLGGKFNLRGFCDLLVDILSSPQEGGLTLGAPLQEEDSSSTHLHHVRLRCNYTRHEGTSRQSVLRGTAQSGGIAVRRPRYDADP